MSCHDGTVRRCRYNQTVAIKWVIATESEREKALALLHDSIAAGITLIAPSLFPVEVHSIIRKRVHNGSLTHDEGVQAYTQLDAVPVQIMDPRGLRQRAREIAERFNQRLVYDSLYAALADLRQCELWTADTRFQRAVKEDLPYVRHIADYT
ncbi:MAG TPA: type II toxin-antitoxin system VapC family toxin [Chthonomonadaceae bacterium]|nr:type II toxin-antitoxin system VapC family toxin [Chthonomonadaceae bacterium]